MSAVPTGIAPIFLVHDMEENILFWHKKLDFSVERFGDPVSFAILARGAARIMLAVTQTRSELVPNWKIEEKMSNAFIWVDDAKAMYDELQNRGVPMDWALYEAPWGGLEFGIQDPEGRDIAIGQILEK